MEELVAGDDHDVISKASRMSIEHGAVKGIERIVFNRQGLVTLVPLKE